MIILKKLAIWDQNSCEIMEMAKSRIDDEVMTQRHGFLLVICHLWSKGSFYRHIVSKTFWDGTGGPKGACALFYYVVATALVNAFLLYLNLEFIYFVQANHTYYCDCR